MKQLDEKPSLFKKLALMHLMNSNQAFFFYNGIIMLLLFALFDVFDNLYSSYLIGFTSPIFIICSFIFILLRFSIYKNIPIVKTNKSKEEKEKPEEQAKIDQNTSADPDQNTGIVTFDETRVNKVFLPIKYLSILYITTNIISAVLSTVLTFTIHPEPYYIKTSDVNMAEFFVSNPNLTRKATVDSINSHLKKPLFHSPGLVESFNLDTTGNYEYRVVFNNPKTQTSSTLTLNSIKCFVANFTQCDAKAFCSCYQGNHCLKDKQFDFFRFLIMAKDTIKDTLYMVRIKEKINPLTN